MDERYDLRAMAAYIRGAAVRIVYLETAWDENLRRNARRPDAVPEDVIDEMLGVLSPPEVFEARHVEWICV